MSVAAETGVVIRSDSLKSQPFIDAQAVVAVAPNDPLTINGRQGGWMQVDGKGASGWIRMLNVRMATVGAPKPAAGASSLMAAASFYQTGSSGKTVTTGVKGLGEEDLRTASPNTDELARLTAAAATPSDATAQAEANHLTASPVDYLKPGRRP